MAVTEPVRPEHDTIALIEGALARIRQHYLFPHRLSHIETDIRQRLADGEYDRFSDIPALCDALTGHLRSVSGDRHFWLCYSIEPQAVTEEPARAPVSWDEQVAELTFHNFRFERVERLRGNVGYLDLRGFVQPEIAGETASAAMTFLARTEALIVDLRRNGGGDPDMVVLIASYLFDQPVHLFTLRWRSGEDRQGWTLPFVQGVRFGGTKPVFILTSGETFSGAESFAYELQARKRATVIGETTRGGGHFAPGWWITPHVGISVPNGRSVSPVTGGNWEGTGVDPDLTVPADQAFDRAYALALAKVLERVGDSTSRPEQRLAEEARHALAAIPASHAG
jgi:C-terminal processing protease CtpA/Prc